MKTKRITRVSLAASRRRRGETDWARVDRLTDAQIRRAAARDPDARLTDRAFWKGARLVKREAKSQVTLRLDRNVLDWFRRQGSGYQTRINAVLRTFVDAQS